MLARLESRHVHGVGVDSHGDIYPGLSHRGRPRVRASELSADASFVGASAPNVTGAIRTVIPDDLVDRAFGYYRLDKPRYA